MKWEKILIIVVFLPPNHKANPMHTQKETNKQGEKKFELSVLFHFKINEVHDGMVRVLA